MSSRAGRADPFSVRKIVEAAANERLYVNDNGMIFLRLGRYDSKAPNIRANAAAVKVAEDNGWIILDEETAVYSATDAGKAAVKR